MAGKEKASRIATGLVIILPCWQDEELQLVCVLRQVFRYAVW